jgi:hypothetical protein
MADSTAAFTKMIPGFDFLQNLMKGAGAAIPGVGQWIVPTLDPEELDKRINDLRTVQFWLEQNARLLATTIQALEVQRMTLSTLQTMNVSMSDLTESLKIRPAAAPAEPAPTPAPSYFRSAPPPPAPEPLPEAAPEPAAAAPTAPPGVLDPMQWWTALTQQFTDLAASALKEGANDATRNLAGAMVKQGFDAASQTLQQAAALPVAAARAAAAASQPAASPAPARKTRAATKKAAPTAERAAAAKRRGG